MTAFTEGIIAFLLYFVVVTMFTAFIFHFVGLIFFKTVNHNKIVLYSLGFVGIMIHELSHMLFAVLFNHRINSVDLFHVRGETMGGSVTTSHNKKSFYQQIGRYFIGVGPTVLGFWLIFLLLALIHPQVMKNLLQQDVHFNEINLFLATFKDHYNQLTTINMNINGKAIMVYFIIISIALFSSVSKEDIRVALRGSFYLIILIGIINIVLSIVSATLTTQIGQWLWHLSFVQVFLVLVIAVFVLVVSLLIGLLKKMISLVT